jgi:hypothetical protein
VRRERRKLTWAFLGISSIFIFTWMMMFYSPIYRFTFIDWPFFGCMTASSFVSLICSTVFMFICRQNYGKGLAQWRTSILFPFSLGDPVLTSSFGGLQTVYVEDAFWKDEFEPDLFPTHVTETGLEPLAYQSQFGPVQV